MALPNELKIVPRQVLEDYVSSRVRAFSVVLAEELGVTERAAVEAGFSRATQRLAAWQPTSEESFFLRFVHKCKFRGCTTKDCELCKNNPHKACSAGVDFDECYADNQVLRSRCDADISIQLVSSTTGLPTEIPGVEVQLSLVDGESASDGSASGNELLKSDDGATLLAAHLTSTRGDGMGRLLVPLTSGCARLPDLYASDKNDTFHCGGQTFASFRLLAVAVQRDFNGRAARLDHVLPALSSKFSIKTQRALNDYRKAEYPHFRDELTKLKFIGNVTAQRLRAVQAHVPGVPFASIDTVEQLRQLLLFADQHRQVENKLLELLNMKGKHKHKWEYLRSVLQERVVYDDEHRFRAWYADGAEQQPQQQQQPRGLVYDTKQSQVNMDKPLGLAVPSTDDNGAPCLTVTPATDTDELRALRAAAEAAWAQPGHPGWEIVRDPVVQTTANGAPLTRRLSGDPMDAMKSESSASKLPGHVRLHSTSPPGERLSGYRSGAGAPSASAGSAPALPNRPLFTFGALPDARMSSAPSCSSAGGARTSAPGTSQHTYMPGMGCAAPHFGAPAAMFPHALSHADAELARQLSAPIGGGGVPAHEEARARAAPMSMAELLGAASRGAANANAEADYHRSSAPTSLMRVPDMPTFSAGMGATLMETLASGGSNSSLGHRVVQTGLEVQRPIISSGSSVPMLQTARSVDAAGDDGAGAKRARAPPTFYSASLFPGDDVGPMLTAGGEAASMQMEPERTPSQVLLYHSESKGRHVPRLKVGSGHMDPAAVGTLEADDLDDPVGDLLTNGLLQPGGVDRERTVSPSGLLSGTLRQVHISDSDTARASDAELAARVSAALQPLPEPAAPAAALPHSNSDSFGKTLNSLLGNSNSDSFKLMMDAVPGSPSSALLGGNASAGGFGGLGSNSFGFGKTLSRLGRTNSDSFKQMMDALQKDNSPAQTGGGASGGAGGGGNSGGDSAFAAFLNAFAEGTPHSQT